MEQKIKKQFGVWMDTRHATVVGRASEDSDNFTVLGVADNSGDEHNTSEKNGRTDGRTLQHKFFKEILSYMPNAEEVHLTGTGTAQEALMHYMADTPQFKNTVVQESTANKMSDENLAAYISDKFN